MKTVSHYFTKLLLILLIAISVSATANEIIFHNNNARHTYTAEIARTESERMHGLMFRESLNEKHAMVFVYSPPRYVSMWMKNTLIPLDIIFVDKYNHITHIHDNAIPHNLTPIHSKNDVAYVIEINGGEAKKHGIAVGDQVTFTSKE